MTGHRYKVVPYVMSRTYPNIVTEGILNSLGDRPPTDNAGRFLAVYHEMSPEGKAEVILWLNGFLSGCPCKNMGVLGAIELLMNSMMLENFSFRLDSIADSISAGVKLLRRRGYTEEEISKILAAFERRRHERRPNK